MSDKISAEEFYDNYAIKYDDVAKKKSNTNMHSEALKIFQQHNNSCLLYTSPSPRDA